jgi:hypothetical protein
MKTLLVVLGMILFIPPALADQKYYDQQEEIRRAAELLDRHDALQRQEAKWRYERQHSSNSSSLDHNIVWLFVKWSVIGLVLLFIIRCGWEILKFGGWLVMDIAGDIPKWWAMEWRRFRGLPPLPEAVKVETPESLGKAALSKREQSQPEPLIPKSHRTGLSVGCATFVGKQ